MNIKLCLGDNSLTIDNIFLDEDHDTAFHVMTMFYDYNIPYGDDEEGCACGGDCNCKEHENAKPQDMWDLHGFADFPELR